MNPKADATPDPRPLVRDPADIRLAMIGMVPGNGHPLSWSAIINGQYDRQIITEAGYPNICTYLDAQPRNQLGLQGVRVTHVCADTPEQSQAVAASAGIPTIVETPEAVIGQVDAVVIATDHGHEHVARARPFVEAGVPLFIDKPLADNAADLRQFIDWHRQGKAFLSTSGLRYAREFASLRQRLDEVGELRLITVLMPKSWERYGIHTLEAAYGLLQPGQYEWVANTSDLPDNTVHLHHRSGVDVLLVHRPSFGGMFGHLQLTGTAGLVQVQFQDTFHAFKTQLEAFVGYLRSGRLPVPFEQTVEQMRIIIAGIASRQAGGRRVMLDSHDLFA